MNVSAMEPLLPEDQREIEDLATDLIAKASTLAGRLHPVMRASVGDLVRAMNCYYSNLIEGHNTLPIDIAHQMTSFPRSPNAAICNSKRARTSRCNG